VVGGARLVALRELRPRVGGERTAADGVSVVRCPPGAPRAVARRPAPRSRRRVAPEPQRRPRSVRDWPDFIAQAVVAVQRLRPRVERVREGAFDWRRRLPKLPTPPGSPATVPGRPAAPARRPTASHPQRRARPVRRRSPLSPRRLVALPPLRPRVARLDTGPRRRGGPLPRMPLAGRGETDGSLGITSEKRPFRY
jgi:hypothetical protein